MEKYIRTVIQVGIPSRILTKPNFMILTPMTLRQYGGLHSEQLPFTCSSIFTLCSVCFVNIHFLFYSVDFMLNRSVCENEGACSVFKCTNLWNLLLKLLLKFEDFQGSGPPACIDEGEGQNRSKYLLRQEVLLAGEAPGCPTAVLVQQWNSFLTGQKGPPEEAYSKVQWWKG